MPRFSLRDIGLLILCLAIVLAGYRYLWRPPPDPNARAHLACYLAILSFTTLGSFIGRPNWRRPCQGYATLGWLVLVCILWGGFKLSDIYDAERVVHGVKLGIVLGCLCAVLAGWLLEKPGARPEAEDQE
jgi:hypothetical protein